MRGTDKTNRIKIVTCLREREAIAYRIDGMPADWERREASHSEMQAWALEVLTESLDSAVDTLYDQVAW